MNIRNPIKYALSKFAPKVAKEFVLYDELMNMLSSPQAKADLTSAYLRAGIRCIPVHDFQKRGDLLLPASIPSFYHYPVRTLHINATYVRYMNTEKHENTSYLSMIALIINVRTTQGRIMDNRIEQEARITEKLLKARKVLKSLQTIKPSHYSHSVYTENCQNDHKNRCNEILRSLREVMK